MEGKKSVGEVRKREGREREGKKGRGEEERKVQTPTSSIPAYAPATREIVEWFDRQSEAICIDSVRLATIYTRSCATAEEARDALRQLKYVAR